MASKATWIDRAFGEMERAARAEAEVARLRALLALTLVVRDVVAARLDGRSADVR